MPILQTMTRNGKVKIKKEVVEQRPLTFWNFKPSPNVQQNLGLVHTLGKPVVFARAKFVAGGTLGNNVFGSPTYSVHYRKDVLCLGSRSSFHHHSLVPWLSPNPVRRTWMWQPSQPILRKIRHYRPPITHDHTEIMKVHHGHVTIKLDHD